MLETQFAFTTPDGASVIARSRGQRRMMAVDRLIRDRLFDSAYANMARRLPDHAALAIPPLQTLNEIAQPRGRSLEELFDRLDNEIAQIKRQFDNAVDARTRAAAREVEGLVFAAILLWQAWQGLPIGRPTPSNVFDVARVPADGEH